MKKSKVLIIIAAIFVSLLIFGVVDVSGKHSDRADAHASVESRIKAAVERGDITPEEGRKRFEAFQQRGEKDSRWDKRGKRRLIKEFGITEDQLAIIKDLRKRQREDMKALRKRYHEAFLNILTDEQRQKWEEKMRGRPSRIPVDEVPNKELRRGAPDKQDRVGEVFDGTSEKANTSAQEVTWGELKKNQ